MAKVNEEDIELWYEDQKQKLSERYIACINKGMNLERRQKKFDRAMEILNAQYDKRHTKLLRKKESDLRNKKRRAGICRPFIAIGRAFITVFLFIGGGLGRAFKAKCANVKFNASMAWIHNGYKITDGVRSAFRPLFYFYVKYLQVPWMILSAPFIRFGRHVKKKTDQTKDSIKNSAAAIWKYTKIAAKWTVKHSTTAYKWVSAKQEGYSKRYHEWYSKRVQAALDKKQKKKEEKEARLKAKAGVVDERPKEGEAVKAPEQAPDAENTS